MTPPARAARSARAPLTAPACARERRALASRGKREQQRGEPAEPQRHRRDVRQVGRQEEPHRVLHARVAGQRRQRDQGQQRGARAPPPRARGDASRRRRRGGPASGRSPCRPRAQHGRRPDAASSQATAAAVQTAPKRVWTTASNTEASIAYQNDTPLDWPPWRTTATTSAHGPEGGDEQRASQARNESRRGRLHSAVPPAAAPSTGPQTHSRNTSSPAPTPIEPYWIALASVNAVLVTAPVFWPDSSCPTVGPAPGLRRRSRTRSRRSRCACRPKRPVRRRVRALREPGLQPDADVCPAPGVGSRLPCRRARRASNTRTAPSSRRPLRRT